MATRKKQAAKAATKTTKTSKTKAAAKLQTAPKAKAQSKPRASAARQAAARPQRPVRAKPETLRLRSAAPAFTVNDIEKSMAWYRDVAGFVVKDRWEEKGKLLGVEVEAGDVSFYLGQDDWKKGRDRVKGVGFRIYCLTVQDIDVMAHQIEARGGVLDHPPTDQPYGMRDFALTDPDGFKITIAAEIRK